jgi:helicase
MRPEAGALRILSTTRAKAKMFEFRVPLEDHIELPRNPDILFSLAVGILGDAAAAIADSMVVRSAVSEGQGPGQRPEDIWDSGDPSLRDSSPEAVRFAATYFDAYLGSRLNETITNEFSLLCAAAYYLADSPGSARVVTRNTPRPNPTFRGGLPHLVHAILTDDFVELDRQYQYGDIAEPLRGALHEFFSAEGDGTALVGICQS